MLEIEPLGDGQGLALAGMLDLSTEEQARRAFEGLAAADTPTLTLDLTRLEFMDSAGLNLIAHLLQRVSGETQLRILVNEGIVDRVLEVSGLRDRPNVTVERA